MSERNYYVICDDNCKFESMTKEQIVAAIAQATGNTPTSVDDAFITKIKEKNAGKTLTFWAGTTAQYNAITTKDSDCIYIVTDDTTGGDIEAALQGLQSEIDDANAKITTLMSKPEQNAVLYSGEMTNFESGALTVPNLSKYSMVVFVLSAVSGAIIGASSASIICYKRTVNNQSSQTNMTYNGVGYPSGFNPDAYRYQIHMNCNGDIATKLDMKLYAYTTEQSTVVYLRKIIGIC